MIPTDQLTLANKDGRSPGFAVSPGSVLRPIAMPRVRTFRNPLGDAAAWYRARAPKWWLTEPIRLGPQKLHIYGVLSRRTWRSGIRSIEVTAERVTIIYSPTATDLA